MGVTSRKIKPTLSVVLCLLTGVLGLLLPERAFSTHIRAGEIRAERVGANSLTFNFVLTVYTDATSSVEDRTARLFFGDGNSQESSRVEPRTFIPSADTWINEYRFSHTYQGIGTYTIYYVGINRNVGVLNMANSENTNFYVETRLTIDAFLGVNSSPVLMNPPVDQGAIRSIYRHNPAAFDPDGDSLSYELLPSRQFITGRGAVPVDAWQFPDIASGGQDSALAGPARLTIDPVRGDLVWDVPNAGGRTGGIGEYNVAILIVEWRRNRFGEMRPIGYVVRDMQIIIRDSRNNPPNLELPPDTCITAGRTYSTSRIIGRDLDPGDVVNLSAFSGILRNENPPTIRATFQPRISQTSNPVVGRLTWQTTCAEVRDEPYDIVIKAEDQGRFLPKLVNQKSLRLKVNGPKPLGLRATARGGGADLNWLNYTETVCPNADSIYVYRRVDSLIVDTNTCITGLPQSSGYELIGKTLSTETFFRDDNRGAGLDRDKWYSYRLVAKFPTPGEGISYPSDMANVILNLDLPVITLVTVDSTHPSTGIISVRWSKPRDIDPTQYQPPYGYRLQRAEGINGTNFTDIFQTSNWENDTTFIDRNIDTRGKQFRYRLFFNYFAEGTQGNRIEISEPVQTATSSFAGTTGAFRSVRLNWAANIPWTYRQQAIVVDGQTLPFRHIIEKKIEGRFVVIDSVVPSTSGGTYTDDGRAEGITLTPGLQYEYRILTRGGFNRPGLPRLIPAFSQQVFGIPIDTTKPIAPGDSGTPDRPCFPNANDRPRIDLVGCTSCQDLQRRGELFNDLRWGYSPTTNPCDTPIVSYNIYYSEREGGEFRLVGSVPNSNTFFRHNNEGSLAGCYYITSIDRFGNESLPSNRLCADNCPYFDLPNVFSPKSGDDVNDKYIPICSIPAFVEWISFKVYNRWGNQVYETSNKGIEWAGVNQLGQDLPTGTYYYACEVQFKRLQPNQTIQRFRGWVDILR